MTQPTTTTTTAIAEPPEGVTPPANAASEQRSTRRRVLSSMIFASVAIVGVLVVQSDNATGNFVKIAQRIPVRISVDPEQPEAQRLRPGMSVVVSIDTRYVVESDREGAALRQDQ